MRSLLWLTIVQSACALSFLLLALASGCILDTPPNEPDAVVPALVRVLNDPDPEVRRNAILALGRIEHPHAVGPLVGRLGDPDPGVREASAWGLGNIGEAALDQAGMPMVQRLSDPSDAVRVAAAQALAAMGATQAMVEALIEILQQRDVQARRAAVQALLGVEARSAYAALVEAVGDEDPRVRQGAIAAIGELGENRAIPLFRDRLAQDTDAGVRGEAAYRLGKLGSPNEVASLRMVAAREELPVVRRWVRWAIDELTPLADSDSGP
jgi:HEAT repeat protein